MIGFLLTLALLQPCQYEDSTYCTWYAEAQGNGHGTTVVNLGDR